MPSKIETELMKITKLRQAADESRKDYLLRLLLAGQQIKPDVWEATLSTEAQSWYNGAVSDYMTHTQQTDIPDFPDLLPPTTTRASMALPPAAAKASAPAQLDIEDDEAPVDEPGEEGDATGGDLEFEEDAPREQEAEVVAEPPRRAAAKPAPAPKPASRPTPKPASTPKKAAAPKPVAAPQPPSHPAPKAASSGNGSAVTAAPGVSKPPRANPPGASTLVKRMLIENFNITNAEIMERLKAEGVNVTQISVSTIRSEFKHSLLILHEQGYATEIGPRA